MFETIIYWPVTDKYPLKMSETGRCVQLEIITPGNETKVMKHSCSEDLTSTKAAVHAVRDELFSHMKKFPGKDNSIYYLKSTQQFKISRRICGGY